MSNKTKTVLPELRFPEFKDAPEWERQDGGSLFDQISNKDHDSNFPVLAVTQEHGAVPRDEINYHVSVSEKSIEGYKVVEIGDFIISLRSFQGGIEYSRYKGLCSPAYVILRNKTKVLDCYFKHFFKTERFIRDMTKNIEGLRDGKMVSYKQFSELMLPFPVLDAEQEKITSCLNSVDKLIKTEEQKLEVLYEHKTGLMQQLFPYKNRAIPELRFPEFKNVHSWKEMRFDKVFTRIKTKNKENNQNSLTISAQDGLVSQLDYFNKKISAKDLTGYYLLEKGDFAYNKSYSQGYPMGAIKRLKFYEKGIVSSLYICFRAKKGYNAEFFEHYFDSGMLNSEIEKIAQEGARNHGLLNVGINDFFETISIVIPKDEEEQQKIADCLSAADNAIFLQSKKIIALQEHKKGLIQQLFPSAEEVTG